MHRTRCPARSLPASGALTALAVTVPLVAVAAEPLAAAPRPTVVVAGSKERPERLVMRRLSEAARRFCGDHHRLMIAQVALAGGGRCEPIPSRRCHRALHAPAADRPIRRLLQRPSLIDLPPPLG